ncbi:MAG: DJ-1/PfpI family protein [Candidatus Sericytochromatia bacterium]|nr:DJ-1/PfpI family protein [Candidatus Sericytochromatia bacterium]
MRVGSRFLAVSMAIAALSPLAAIAEPAAPKRVVMIVNDGLWAPEYYEPRRIFDQAGFTVIVAGKYSGQVYPDRRNATYGPITVDTTFDKVDLAQFDAITFAGGNGAWTDYFPNEDAHKLVREAFRQKKVIGLLCASTGLLGIVDNLDGQGPGLASGRHVTGYYRVEGIMRTLGHVTFDPGEKGKPYVVTDGNLITGRDPESSTLFGETVTQKLLGLPDKAPVPVAPDPEVPPAPLVEIPPIPLLEIPPVPNTP